MTAVSRTSFGQFSITRLFAKFGLLCLFIFTLFTFNFPLSAVHAAQPPTIINYQGKLLNSSGQSVTTTVSISLVLFTASSGGTAVYTAGGTLSATSTISITPTNGIFTISLGDGVLTNALPPDIFQTNQNLYLDVYIGSDHLSPRKQIIAVPYAYNAKYLDGVAATTTASSSIYIPISDAQGNFNFRHITSTDIFVSGTSTLATTTFTGTVTVTKELIAQAIKDALGWIPNQATPAKLSTGFNNGGFGGGATPGNLSMTSSDFSFFNLAPISSNYVGFCGSVFDGRYLYLTSRTAPNSSYIAQYDTTGSFNTTSSWNFYRTTSDRAYCGGVFDGRYIFFAPNEQNSYHGYFLKFDTTSALTDSGAWTYFDPSTAGSTAYSSAVFDGRYVYFIPERSFSSTIANAVTVPRYDTTLSFSSNSSWESFNLTNKTPSGDSTNTYVGGYGGGVFDGRYLYLVPSGVAAGRGHGLFLRFDTAQTFTSANSWELFNATSSFSNVNLSGYSSAAFDGRYVYFAPNFNYSTDMYEQFHGNVLRYDTAASFVSTTGWSSFDPSTYTDGTARGFTGVAFDGRYVTFVPGAYNRQTFFPSIYFYNSLVTRYDTSMSFTASTSWAGYSLLSQNSSAKGYRGAGFDGRYLYLIPEFNYAASTHHGLVVRLRAYAGGVDTANSISKIARSSDFFLDSNSKVGIGTNSPTKLLTIKGTVSSTTGISIGTGITTSSLDHERGLIIASTTANRLGLFNVEPVNGNVSASGTLRTFGGVTGMGISVSSTATTNTVFSYFTNNTVGNALVFDTNTTITSSTSALYSWRNNGFKLMSLSASGTLDVYGSISSMNASLGSPGTPGDLSERVDVKQSEFNELVPGDVLTVDLDSPDTYKKTTGNQTDPVMGVIATHPTLILGNGKTQYTKILTFLGRTNVKVSLKNGAIKKGDPLTNAQNEPGKAMKQTDGGPTIGTALEDYFEYTEQNQGQILTLVRPGWYEPSKNVSATTGTSEASTVNPVLQAVLDALKSLGIWVENGVTQIRNLMVDSLDTKKVVTDQLCIGGTCVNKSQLQALLEKNSIQTAPPAESVMETSTTTSEVLATSTPEMATSTSE